MKFSSNRNKLNELWMRCSAGAGAGAGAGSAQPAYSVFVLPVCTFAMNIIGSAGVYTDWFSSYSVVVISVLHRRHLRLSSKPDYGLNSVQYISPCHTHSCHSYSSPLLQLGISSKMKNKNSTPTEVSSVNFKGLVEELRITTPRK